MKGLIVHDSGGAMACTPWRPKFGLVRPGSRPGSPPCPTLSLSLAPTGLLFRSLPSVTTKTKSHKKRKMFPNLYLHDADVV